MKKEIPMKSIPSSRKLAVPSTRDLIFTTAIHFSNPSAPRVFDLPYPIE